MKKYCSIVVLTAILLAGCGKPFPATIRHHVVIPSTNHYSLGVITTVRTDLFSRRAPSAPAPPQAVVEYSFDGKSYKPFPLVQKSTASNTMSVHELTVTPEKDLWIKTTTTNQSDVGRSFQVILFDARR